MTKQSQDTAPRSYAAGIPVYCAYDQIIPISELKPNPKNPNKHPQDQLEKLGKIIRGNGWRNPITVSTRSGLIVKGHGRMMAAELEEFNEVPVEFQNYESDEAELADLTADNRIAELAEMDTKMLTEIFADIDTGAIDFELSGYTEKEYEELATALADAVDKDLEDPDEVPDVDEEGEPITQTGDIWIIGGRHRVMCGDSTDRATIGKLMDGKKADLVFTDPPYGMKKEADGVANDNLNYDDLLAFNKQWIPLTFEALKDNGSWYCWGTDEPLMDIFSEILKPLTRANEITFRNYITWDKGHGLGQLSPDHRQYPTATEKCLFVMCGVQGFNNNADNYFDGFEPLRKYLADSKEKMGWNDKDIQRITGVTTVARHCFGKSQWEFPTEKHYKAMQAEAQGDAFKREYDEIKREYYATRAYFDNTHDNMNDVWHFARTTGEEREAAGGHATPKPVELCGRAIKSSSRSGELVLDVFGGSGSTLVACEQLNRTAYLMELEPKWCDVIVKRYIKATGSNNVKCIRNGERLPREEIADIFNE